jgi:hypothetical protein
MSQVIDKKRKGLYNPKYTEREVWPVILERISGGQSLMGAVKAMGIPYATVKHQLRHSEALKKQYYSAIEERGDYLADELVDLSDEMPPADLDPQLINAWVNRQRLRIDARKWTASKLRPKVWGDKIDVSVTHTQISINEALRSAESRLIDNVTDIVPNEPKDNLESTD